MRLGVLVGAPCRSWSDLRDTTTGADDHVLKPRGERREDRDMGGDVRRKMEEFSVGFWDRGYFT